MQFEMITKLQNQLDTIEHKTIDEGVAFWFARDLQIPLGYDRWENFMVAIKRAIESCKTTGMYEDHFRGVTKMIPGQRSRASCRRLHAYSLCVLSNCSKW